MKNKITGALIGATFAYAAPAMAHVTLEQPKAAAGSTYKAVVGIGHGCGDKATTALRIQIPEGVYDVKPMPKPGWTLQTQTGPYAKPFDDNGTKITEGVRQIVWSGGALPDAWYDEFTFRAVVGTDLAPGSAVYFPTVQECDGATEQWIDVTGAQGVANPAPALQITPGDADAPARHNAGDIMISGQFTRATPPGAKIAGGFMTLKNDGVADRLVSAETPLAGRVQIHQMSMEGEVMKMRQLPDGLDLPAGESIELKPGGYHLMMMGLTQPLVQGDSVPLTLNFEKAGKIELTLPVMAINAKGGDHAH